MNPERWQQVQDLFSAALVLEVESRGFVAAQAGEDHQLRDEVLSLLAAHAQAAETTFLAHPTATGGPVGDLPQDLPEIERYHWIGRLGEGGMGTVYLAVRSDDAYQQQVAIKLLRRDLDRQGLIRRFHRERQILAELDHPNIARLLDGGTASDGRPYLVMEYVAGWPIDVYCQQHQLGIEDRLRLVGKVCSAVHAAHQRLIVHRDLKPANILVNAEGEPKLLDFGIAKALDPAHQTSGAETVPGRMPMTPEYASPEQMRGLTVTTVSDIYSLGVLLYELLTSRRPLAVAVLPAERALRRLLEDIPTRPSTVIASLAEEAEGTPAAVDDWLGEAGSRRRSGWAKRLIGDLDSIVLTALAKEPGRRYGSAEALAEDLDRHLQGLPVVARGNSRTYLVGRFVRRHRSPVAIALVALLGQTAVMVGLALQRAETLRQRDRASAVTETLVEIFDKADPGHARGATLTARSVLDSGRQRIAGLADQPQLQADLQLTMGRVYTSLGLLPPALELLGEALDTRRRQHQGDHREVAEAAELLAQALHDADRSAEASQLLSEALAMRRRLHGHSDGRVAESLLLLGTALHRQGEYGLARQHYAEAVEIRRRGTDVEALGRTLNALGTFERDLGDYSRAEMLHREAVALLELERSAAAEPELAWALANLGTALRRQASYDQAEQCYQRAEQIQRRLYHEPHQVLAYTLDQFGLLRLSQSRLDAAEGLLQEALRMHLVVFGDDHARVADSRANLAKVALVRGDLEAAQEGFGAALKMLREVLPAGHKDLATAMNHHADVLVHQGEFKAAEELFEEALAIERRHFGDRHRSVALIMSNLARSLSARGEHRRAVSLREESVDILRQHLGPEHPDLAALLYNLGVSYHYAGEFDAAAERYRQALAIAEPALGAEHSLVVVLHQVLADLESGGEG